MPGEPGPVRCGGVQVAPGDVLVGDDDGIVVGPEAELAAVLDAAEALQGTEAGMLAGIRSGTSLFERLDYDEHLARLRAGEDSCVCGFRSIGPWRRVAARGPIICVLPDHLAGRELGRRARDVVVSQLGGGHRHLLADGRRDRRWVVGIAVGVGVHLDRLDVRLRLATPGGIAGVADEELQAVGRVLFGLELPLDLPA